MVEVKHKDQLLDHKVLLLTRNKWMKQQVHSFNLLWLLWIHTELSDFQITEA